VPPLWRNHDWRAKTAPLKPRRLRATPPLPKGGKDIWGTPPDPRYGAAAPFTLAGQPLPIRGEGFWGDTPQTPGMGCRPLHPGQTPFDNSSLREGGKGNLGTPPDPRPFDCPLRRTLRTGAGRAPPPLHFPAAGHSGDHDDHVPAPTLRGRPTSFEAAKLTSADRRADTWLRSDYWETKLPQELPEGTVTVLFTEVEGDMTSRCGDAAALGRGSIFIKRRQTLSGLAERSRVYPR
jgi:hypothetical protein